MSRNCPWNRCAFCPVYKADRFSRRSVAEVEADIFAMRAAFTSEPTTAFLQDADAMTVRVDDLVAILDTLRTTFPGLRRVTTYARARTLVRRTVSDLQRLRRAGLDRIHVGLESGSDRVLALVHKGASRAQQIDAGQRVKAAGLELSEYVMPGLGGRTLSAEHADDTASALIAIAPDVIRLRTTAVVPGTDLAELAARGEFEPLDEIATVAEIRRLIAALGDLETRIESDHVLNLLMELRGDLPHDRPSLLDLCDRALALPAEEREAFVFGRRLGLIATLADLEHPGTRRGIVDLVRRHRNLGADPSATAAGLRAQRL